ncbi:unnamed protein product [Schistocephalus solidus]|uniref:Transposase n=1 Tax=Schistocephalus solidus TaxID=70667 RepID=A0A183T5T9_SCHSO|nr:unnamed protein product [Schistocephalus solidus]
MIARPPGVEVEHRPEATIWRQVMRPKDPLPRQETSGVVYRVGCGCRPSNYVGETGRLLWTLIAEHAAAVRQINVNSQAAAHSARTGYRFKFDEAEILERGDNRVSRELLESSFTGPSLFTSAMTSLNAYSMLRLSLVRAIGHSRNAQANAFSKAGAGDSDGRAVIMPTYNTGDENSAIDAAQVYNHF